MFLVALIFLRILKLNPDNGELNLVDPKRDVVLVYLHKKEEKNEFNLISKEIENEERVDLVSVDCTQNKEYCSKYPEKFPLISQHFEDKVYNFKLIQTVNVGAEDAKRFVKYACAIRTEDINGQYLELYKKTRDGGSAFHLRVNSLDNPILKEYNLLSRIYVLHKCSFSYTITKECRTPYLSIYKSKRCMTLLKGKQITELATIIHDNKFSHFHSFAREEFLELVNETSGIVALLPISALNDKYINVMEEVSTQVCQKYEMGWTPRKETELGFDLKTYQNTQAQFGIVNRWHDCLFIVNINDNIKTTLYYIRDSFTNTQCWRYPDGSKKAVPVKHYRKFLIVCSLGITVFYFIFAYPKITTILPMQN